MSNTRDDEDTPLLTETSEYKKGMFDRAVLPAAVLPGGSWQKVSDMVHCNPFLPVLHRHSCYP